MPLEGESSLAFSLVESVLVLIGVCLFAVVALRWIAARGFGRSRGRFLEVIDRLPLDARRSLVAVRAADRVLLVGLGEGAAPVLVAELDGSTLPEPYVRDAPGLRNA